MGYSLVNVLGVLLIVTSSLVVLSKTVGHAIMWYAGQSLILVGVLVSLGITTGTTELLTWGASAFVTKVLLVPAIIWTAYKKMGQPDVSGLKSAVSAPWFVVIVIAEVVLSFAVVSNVELPTAADALPALAISFAHFFVGLTCIVTQRNILKQVFGYCLMENGSHVTLALLAPTAPEIVEIGIATDAFFAVIIMSIVVMRIWRDAHTLDSHDLTDLRG